MTIKPAEDTEHKPAISQALVFIKKWRFFGAVFVCGLVYIPAFFIGTAMENKDWLPLFMFWGGMAYQSYLTWSCK